MFTLADLESSGVFDGVDIEEDIINVLIDKEIIAYESNYDVYMMGESSFSLSSDQVGDIWKALQDYGFITIGYWHDRY